MHASFARKVQRFLGRCLRDCRGHLALVPATVGAASERVAMSKAAALGKCVTPSLQKSSGIYQKGCIVLKSHCHQRL